MNETPKIRGIQELIEHLKVNGVEEGKQEAEQLLDAARREAKAIENDASRKSKQMIADAEDEISRKRKSAEEAMQLAARDALLRLRQEIENDLVEQLRRLLRDQLSDRKLLKEWLIRILQSSAEADEGDRITEILLPPSVDPENKWSDPPSQSDLESFLGSTTEKMLEEGIAISIRNTNKEGIVIHKKGGEVEVRLDEETLLDLLRDHLMPRFRHLLRTSTTSNETES